MTISVLYTYLVRYEVSDHIGWCFGGRANVTTRSFTEIPDTIAKMRRVPVETVVIETAVLIDRKEYNGSQARN